jgi:hypothetical protein
VKYSTSDLYIAAVVLLLMKLLAFGLSSSEALGALVILAALLGKTVIDNMFPKRANLFKEVHEISVKLDAINVIINEHESDLTALKFGAMRK